MNNLVFDKQYKKVGLASQRRYPNEYLIQFLAGNFFHRSPKERSETPILEIGCGSGANLWMIAKEGFDTYGIDISPAGIALCKDMLESYGVEAKLHVSDMKMLPFEDCTFSAIVDVLTVEHTDLEGHRETFSEIRRCLHKGGKFFSWHLGAESENFTRGGGTRLDRYTIDNAPNDVPYRNNGMTCFLTPAVAKKFLIEAGFEDIKIERVRRTYRDMQQEIEYLSITATA